MIEKQRLTHSCTNIRRRGFKKRQIRWRHWAVGAADHHHQQKKERAKEKKNKAQRFKPKEMTRPKQVLTQEEGKNLFLASYKCPSVDLWSAATTVLKKEEKKIRLAVLRKINRVNKYCSSWAWTHRDSNNKKKFSPYEVHFSSWWGRVWQQPDGQTLQSNFFFNKKCASASDLLLFFLNPAGWLWVDALVQTVRQKQKKKKRECLVSSPPPAGGCKQRAKRCAVKPFWSPNYSWGAERVSWNPRLTATMDGNVPRAGGKKEKRHIMSFSPLKWWIDGL